MTEHAALARKLFFEGYNCSQAVFCAVCDVTGLDIDTAARMSSSFGAGLGRLREVCGALGFTDTPCLQARAEECGALREMFDCAVSRAVARLNVLCELCLPYVKVGGCFLALKGPAAAAELPEAGRAIALLGGTYERTVSCALPGAETEHGILVIRKTAPTPKKYPRRFALIKSAPL